MKLIPASSAAWMIFDGVVVVGVAPLAEHHRPEAERADLHRRFDPGCGTSSKTSVPIDPSRAGPDTSIPAKHAAACPDRVVGTAFALPVTRPADHARREVGQPGEEEVALGAVLGQFEGPSIRTHATSTRERPVRSDRPFESVIRSSG